MNQKWIDQDYRIERTRLEILIALGWRLTFWLMIGCGLDEQPFNFMGRKLFNLPKNSFSSAKYANGLIKWHKLCHMILHVTIRYTTFPKSVSNYSESESWVFFIDLYRLPKLWITEITENFSVFKLAKYHDFRF